MKSEKNYKEIIVSNRSPLEQSYIFFLFYLKYPPENDKLYASILKTGGALVSEHKDGMKLAGFGPDSILTFLPDCPYHTAVGFGKASELDLHRIFYKIDNIRAFIQVSQADQVRAIKSVLFMEPDYKDTIRGKDIL